MRAAGLLDALRDRGADVRDHGDRDVWRWRPDRERRDAQNLDAVVGIVRDTADRVGRAAAAGETTLVLGGDCTVGIGTAAGHAAGGPIGLLYFDTHADLNVPASVREGALDWMGMAHMLDVPGAAPDLVAAGPGLAPEDVLLFAWGPEQATAHERRVADELGVARIPVDEVAADPRSAAAAALARLPDRIVVHFDVDVIDFTDVPLSENTGRNEGLPYATALRALEVLLASSSVVGVTITELNPLHVEEGAGTLERFARDVAAAISP